MRRALHIFKKDARQFRVEIGGLLALVVFFALADARTWSTMTDASHRSDLGLVLGSNPLFTTDGRDEGGISGVSSGIASSWEIDSSFGLLAQPFLVLLWCYLIARVIHADALSDDHQFWLTRPYGRRSLWAAKAIFVLAVVNLPLLLAQAWIVMRDGLGLAPHIPGLLWGQVLVTVGLVLPVAALAAVTVTLSQFIFSAVAGVAVTTAVIAFSASWGGLEWIRYGVLLTGALVVSSTVLFLQFIRRRTFLSRAVMVIAGGASVAVFPLVPWKPMFVVQAHLAGPSSGSPRAELVLPPPANGPRYGVSDTIDLQFRTTGVANGTLIACEGAEITIDAPSRATWQSGFVGSRSSIARASDGCGVRTFVNSDFFEKAVDQKIRLRTALYFTVLGDERSMEIPAGGSAAAVPGVGACAAFGGGDHGRDDMVWCRSPFRSPSVLVWAPTDVDRGVRLWQALSYSPFPAEWRLNPDPIDNNFHAVVATSTGAVIINTAKPVAHIRTDIDVRDVRLGDFELGAAGKN